MFQNIFPQAQPQSGQPMGQPMNPGQPTLFAPAQNPSTPFFPNQNQPTMFQTPQGQPMSGGFQTQPTNTLGQMNPQSMMGAPQNQPGMMNSQFLNMNQQIPPTGSLSSILHQPQSLNLTPLSQQNFAWKISQKSDSFSLNIGNTLRDKEVQTLNPPMRTRITQYDNQLEDNKKYLKNCNEQKANIHEISQKLKKDLYNISSNSILLRNTLKREKFIFDDLKNEISISAIIVNDFVQYYELLKKGRLQSIQVPSTFLTLAADKLLGNMKVLKSKIDEIIDLAKTQFSRKETSEFGDDYEFVIHLIGELYQYFMYVAYLVMKFDETYTSFRTEALEHYKSYGYVDLEKNLEHESKRLYKDDMIENLMKIMNKLEENKKIEKEQLKVLFFIFENCLMSV